jgi:hypothetical protein
MILEEIKFTDENPPRSGKRALLFELIRKSIQCSPQDGFCRASDIRFTAATRNHATPKRDQGPNDSTIHTKGTRKSGVRHELEAWACVGCPTDHKNWRR